MMQEESVDSIAQLHSRVNDQGDPIKALFRGLTVEEKEKGWLIFSDVNGQKITANWGAHESLGYGRIGIGSQLTFGGMYYPKKEDQAEYIAVHQIYGSNPEEDRTYESNLI